ncbi:MAG TPA: aminotransferase class V-fold PLP-dependent enzyme [Chlamydiales bacterium]|nr:aminotransferase class V-fold PLP-dependent enzyme [Chlamydiales bacterium]
MTKSKDQKRLFGSDNFSGVHPQVMRAIEKANVGHVRAYGNDAYTQEAKALLLEQFGASSVLFLFTGTGANVVGLQAILQSHQSVICPQIAHILTHECGAVENFIGCQLCPVTCQQGKLLPSHIEPYLEAIGDVRHTQPKVISISQATEMGTVYSVKEIKALSQKAHKHGMFLHMDGARLANAAVAESVSFEAMTAECGVDVLSFSGTKNGMMVGEALLFFGKLAEKSAPFIQKQAMQMGSKMRFLSAQFTALFENDLWKKNALQSNQMAKLFERELKKIKEVEIVEPVETNALFVKMPKKAMLQLQKESYFGIWNKQESIARFMTTWDTEESDVHGFIQLLKKSL